MLTSKGSGIVHKVVTRRFGLTMEHPGQTPAGTSRSEWIRQSLFSHFDLAEEKATWPRSISDFTFLRFGLVKNGDPYLFDAHADRHEANSLIREWLSRRCEQAQIHTAQADPFCSRSFKSFRRLQTEEDRDDAAKRLQHYIISRTHAIIARARKEKRSLCREDFLDMMGMEPHYLIGGLLEYIVVLFDDGGEVIGGYNGKSEHGLKRIGSYEVARMQAKDQIWHNALHESHIAAIAEAHEVLVVPFAWWERPDDPDELALALDDMHV